jgi:hypothetical protein
MGSPKRRNHKTKDLNLSSPVAQSNPSPGSLLQGENSHKVKSMKRLLLTNVNKTQLKPHLGFWNTFKKLG